MSHWLPDSIALGQQQPWESLSRTFSRLLWTCLGKAPWAALYNLAIWPRGYEEGIQGWGPFNYLCDCGQVPSLPRASVSASIKWKVVFTVRIKQAHVSEKLRAVPGMYQSWLS